MNCLYIIKPNDFKGYPYSTMPVVEPEKINGTVIHYSDKKFSEYNTEHEGNLIAVTEEIFFRDYYKPYLDKLCGTFEEITEESYLYNLNVLPPAKWHNYRGIEIFFVSECYTANIYTCCIRAGKRFFKALRPINVKDEDLLNQITELTK